MINIIGENRSLVNQIIAEIRDVNIQRDSLRFRKNLEKFGEITAYEISKTLNYSEKEMKTPLGISKVPLSQDKIVIASILRAGLPLHNGFLNYLDRSENAFISAYRKYDDKGSFKINFEYISTPSVDGKIIILSDPMLATGASIELAYKALMSKGNPKHIHIVSVIASKQGIDFIKSKLPASKITLWMGAIDESLNSKSYIVPGCGDVGDLAFGVKL